MRVDLPGDQWVDLKDPDDLLEGDRKAVRKSLEVNTDGEGNMLVGVGMLDDMFEAVYRQVITAWSFEGKPVPSMLPGVTDGLSIRHAKALRKAVQPHNELLWGSDDNADPTVGA